MTAKTAPNLDQRAKTEAARRPRRIVCEANPMNATVSPHSDNRRRHEKSWLLRLIPSIRLRGQT